jgi:hypothetical protein
MAFQCRTSGDKMNSWPCETCKRYGAECFYYSLTYSAHQFWTCFFCNWQVTQSWVVAICTLPMFYGVVHFVRTALFPYTCQLVGLRYQCLLCRRSLFIDVNRHQTTITYPPAAPNICFFRNSTVYLQVRRPPPCVTPCIEMYHALEAGRWYWPHSDEQERDDSIRALNQSSPMLINTWPVSGWSLQKFL